jgi:hypothetical protein
LKDLFRLSLTKAYYGQTRQQVEDRKQIATDIKEHESRLFQMDRIYESGSMEIKRQVIGSMYPENLTFDGEQLPTTRINEAVRLIYTLDKGLLENEKGQNGNFSILSSQVDLAGFEPFLDGCQTNRKFRLYLKGII